MATADKRIAEIESFKNYEVTKFNNEDDLKLLSDSATKITELTHYARKGKSNFSGKLTQNSRTKIGEIKRTYYFNERSELFAIVDSITTADNRTRKLTYYFGGGQLTNVVDENKNDVTNTVNKQQLYLWIRRMFDDKTIAK
ncbi:hypothetical protein D4L85_02450 [Chryseolinea soli]|uniref:Uncharacterized protein n=2 Tax=Chryseolinea soli TaxID=2321403 RepID=A0A385SCY7_9BACT|nr:hypothetical protein D4L85_02450 [Chryseolinea soli]